MKKFLFIFLVSFGFTTQAFSVWNTNCEGLDTALKFSESSFSGQSYILFQNHSNHFDINLFDDDQVVVHPNNESGEVSTKSHIFRDGLFL